MQNYSKTMALILAGALSVNGITVLGAEGKGNNLVVENIKSEQTIESFNNLGELSKQTVKQGTTREALNLPQTVEAKVGLAGSITTTDSLKISHIESIAVTWEEVTPYDKENAGTYVFEAVLPEGYYLAENVDLPSIEITVVHNKEIDASEIASCYIELKNGYEVSNDRFLHRSLVSALKESFSDSINYREQLTENQKKVYDALTEITPVISEVEVQVELYAPCTEPKEALQKALDDENLAQAPIDALIKDYPEICWLSFEGANKCGMNATVVEAEAVNGGLKMKVELTINTPAKEAYQEAGDFLEDMEDKVSQIIEENIEETDTDYEKLLKFNDYLCTHVSYGENNFAHEAYGALNKGESVCEGYAEAFKMLCDRVDIPCILVVGTGTSGGDGGAHMWNYVKLEGSWYAVDVTWDDTDIEGKQITCDYFLVGQETICREERFGDTHLADGHFVKGGKEFAYPMLSSERYSVKEKEEGLPAPKVNFDEDTNTFKIAEAAVGKTYEVLYEDKNIFELEAEGEEIAISVNDLIDCIDQYELIKGNLKIRVAADENTKVGESWVSDRGFKFAPTIVGAEVPAKFIQGTKIPVTLISDVNGDWLSPDGKRTGTYTIVDNIGREIYRGQLKEIGEWEKYSCEDEAYELSEYNGNWCFQAEIEVPDNYAGAAKIIVEPEIEECKFYSASIKLEDPHNMAVEILKGLPVKVALTGTSKVTYGEDIIVQAEVFVEPAVYNGTSEGCIQFSKDGEWGPIAEIEGDEESGYRASYTWHKLPCKASPYEIQARYVPYNANDKVISTDSQVSKVQVTPRILTPSIDLSNVSSKKYDGTTKLKEGDMPRIILKGALQGEEPTVIADYELTGKEVGTQKVKATNIKLDNTNPVNKNYKLENDIVISEGTINIEKVETDKPSGGDQTDKPSGGSQIDTPSSNTSSNTSHRSSSGGGRSSKVEEITFLTKLNKLLPDTIIASKLTDKEINELQNSILQDKNLSVLKGESLVITLKNKDSVGSFEKPVLLTMDLSKVEIVNPNEVTLVKYEKDSQGNVAVTKLGGSYNKETKEFKAYVEDEGIYDVVEDKQLLNIELTLNSRVLKVNGSEIINDIAPERLNDTTMVPLRFIAEKLGADIKWNNRNKRITITLDNKVITLKADKEAVLKNGRTLVPIRYISENLGAHVLWLEENKQVQVVK